jgi:hypothetical protein
MCVCERERERERERKRKDNSLELWGSLGLKTDRRDFNKVDHQLCGCDIVI